MSSVADGAAVEPSLGERASSLPLVPPGSLAEAANRSARRRVACQRSTRAHSTRLPDAGRGPVGVDEPRRRPFWPPGKRGLAGGTWADALADGVTAVADLEIAHGHVAHAIVKLVDAERAPLGQGVLSVALPWSAARPAPPPTPAL